MDDWKNFNVKQGLKTKSDAVGSDIFDVKGLSNVYRFFPCFFSNKRPWKSWSIELEPHYDIKTIKDWATSIPSEKKVCKMSVEWLLTWAIFLE